MVQTTRFDSPIGELILASTEKGLAYLGLPRANGRGFAGWHRRHAQEEEVADGQERNQCAMAQVKEFLEGKRQTFDLELDLRATPFQLSVYQILDEIPYGEAISYAEVARRLGRPSAVRAVGSANGSNPMPLIVPCHRVVAADGQLHGYAGGVDLKARLLAMESATRPAAGQLF
jgi:O-6-methylguanine DNA methyltransferase